MKKLLLTFTGIALATSAAQAQCTPVDCNQDLLNEGINYGGTCDSMVMDGVVGQPYSDFESFVVTDNCFDAGEIDPSQAGLDIKITNIDNITFSDMPAGIVGATDQASYSPPSGGYITGCANFSGTPTEAGVFNDTIHLLADIELCGFIPVPQNDNPATYRVWMTIKPDPSFTLAASYCSTDAAVTLTANVSTGGTFYVNGAPSATFDPAALGAGTHTVKYVVTKMEGAAIAPASDSLTVTVDVVTPGGTVYADTDNDGYGNPTSSITLSGCTIPAGYVGNDDDCDDTNNAIYPGATDIAGNGIDENCDGVDGYLGIDEVITQHITIYPNPARDMINIEGLDKSLVNDIQLVDLNGNIVSAINFNMGAVISANVKTLEAGIYFININYDGVNEVVRFIKE